MCYNLMDIMTPTLDSNDTSVCHLVTHHRNIQQFFLLYRFEHKTVCMSEVGSKTRKHNIEGSMQEWSTYNSCQGQVCANICSVPIAEIMFLQWLLDIAEFVWEHSCQLLEMV